MRVYIIGNDGITLCRKASATVNDGEIAVASNEELHAAPLSAKRLLALWNALPGGEKRKKVGERDRLAASYGARRLLGNPEEKAGAHACLGQRGARPGVPHRRAGELMKPPLHDASARQHTGEPSSGLGPVDIRNDRLRNPDLASLDGEIAGLVDRWTQELRRAWRTLHHTGPPLGLSRDLIIRGLADKLQQRAQGGPTRAL